jgi:hypothetical protein
MIAKMHIRGILRVSREDDTFLYVFCNKEWNKCISERSSLCPPLFNQGSYSQISLKFYIEGLSWKLSCEFCFGIILTLLQSSNLTLSVFLKKLLIIWMLVHDMKQIPRYTVFIWNIFLCKIC